MKLWIIVLAFFFALFLAAVVAVGALFFLLSQRPSPPPPRPRIVQPQPNGAPRPNTSAPQNPGAQATERWEGYYYATLDSFERVCAKDVQRTRFWLDVRRSEDGTFSAECQELSNLGASTVSGRFDQNTGAFEFTKIYKEGGHAWRYEGRWVSQNRRVEGTFGERDGGFVLFMRHLSRSETKYFERPLNAPPVPKEVAPPQNDPLTDAPPGTRPKPPAPKSLPSAEPKNDQF